MTELTLSQFTTSLANTLSSFSDQIAVALQLRGGGNTESWAITQYLILAFPGGGLTNLDYYREYRPPRAPTNTSKKFVDLAFNVLSAQTNNPPILAEWKCTTNVNTLSTGFFGDQDKFSEMLPYPAGLQKPYPILVGIAPRYDGGIGPGVVSAYLQNGVSLYLSTKETWKARGLAQYTAYGADQDIPEQVPVAAGRGASLG